MNYALKKEKEIEKEINSMSLEELLYLDLNPNYFVYNHLKPQIEQIKDRQKQIQMKQEELQNRTNYLAREELKETHMLREQIEKLYFHIDKLLAERENLNYKIPKDEFLNLLDNELKEINNPDICFSKLKEKKINFQEFEKQFAQLGKNQNYYYYKLIYERIKND